MNLLTSQNIPPLIMLGAGVLVQMLPAALRIVPVVRVSSILRVSPIFAPIILGVSGIPAAPALSDNTAGRGE